MNVSLRILSQLERRHPGGLEDVELFPIVFPMAGADDLEDFRSILAGLGHAGLIGRAATSGPWRITGAGRALLAQWSAPIPEAREDRHPWVLSAVLVVAGCAAGCAAAMAVRALFEGLR